MTTLLCIVGTETYELELSDDGLLISIIRSSLYAAPELLSYDNLAPIIRDRIDQRIRHFHKRTR